MEDNKDEVSTHEGSTNKEHKNWFERNEEGFKNRLWGWGVAFLFMYFLISFLAGPRIAVGERLFLTVVGGILFEGAYALYKHIHKQLKEILMFMGIVALALLSALVVKMLFKGVSL